MISPWVDLRNNSDSVINNKNIDPVLTKESLDFFASLYIGNNKLSETNPIETLFGVFPPTLFLGDKINLPPQNQNNFFKKTPPTPFNKIDN